MKLPKIFLRAYVENKQPRGDFNTLSLDWSTPILKLSSMSSPLSYKFYNKVFVVREFCNSLAIDFPYLCL